MLAPFCGVVGLWYNALAPACAPAWQHNLPVLHRHKLAAERAHLLHQSRRRPWLTAAHHNAPLPVPHAERQILLAFAGNISNWPEVQAARQLAGWAPCTPDACTPVCLWGGVSCDAFGSADGTHVTSL